MSKDYDKPIITARDKILLSPPVTLGETVYRMVSEGKQNTPEFEKLVIVFGRERLRKLYKEEKDKLDRLRGEVK